MSEVPLNEDEYSTVKFLYEYLIHNTEYDTNAEDTRRHQKVVIINRRQKNPALQILTAAVCVGSVAPCGV